MTAKTPPPDRSTSGAADGGRTGRVAVLGAGRMGTGIAQVFAAAGIPVALHDPAPVAFAERIAAICRITGADPDEVLARIWWYDTIPAAVSGATLVIEAGPEKLAVKRDIFGQAEAATGPDTILATNTSAIPIAQIASGSGDPGRVVGTHFWNPPYLIPLVEVVPAPVTRSAVLDRTVEILGSVGLRPVRVRVDVPGFVGNRLQHALKREAIALVANGICSPDTVDTVVRLGFGRRLALVGPLEQADLGGLDLTLAIHQVLMPDLDNTPVPHPLLVELVEHGDLGAKSGKGFYEWRPGEADRRREEIDRGLSGA
jgi:3-hydroxybutyryl-CoA dehydrogenase